MATLFGFSFPFREGTQSFPEVATDNDAVRQSLIQLLGTVRGERQMRPDFGTDLIKRVFESNTPALADICRYEVQIAVTRYEPRVLLQKVDAVRDVDKGVLRLEIEYVNTVTQQLQGLQMTLPIPLGG